MESPSVVCLKMDPCRWCRGALWRANVQSRFCKMSVIISKHFLPLGKMTWVHRFRSYLLENGSWSVQANKAQLFSIQTDMLGWRNVLWWYVFHVCICLQQVMRVGPHSNQNRVVWVQFQFSSMPWSQCQDLCS